MTKKSLYSKSLQTQHQYLQSNVFNLPQQFSGANSIATTTTPAQTAGGTTAYIIQTATSTQVANGVVEVFADGVLLSDALYNISGTTINFFSQPTAGQTLIVNVYPKEFYRLGQVLYSSGGGSFNEDLQRVDRGELYHLLSSKLTAPNTRYPIYTYENNKIIIYPTSINSGVTTSYIRKTFASNLEFLQLEVIINIYSMLQLLLILSYIQRSRQS